MLCAGHRGGGDFGPASVSLLCKLAYSAMGGLAALRTGNATAGQAAADSAVASSALLWGFEMAPRHRAAPAARPMAPPLRLRTSPTANYSGLGIVWSYRRLVRKNTAGNTPPGPPGHTIRVCCSCHPASSAQARRGRAPGRLTACHSVAPSPAPPGAQPPRLSLRTASAPLRSGTVAAQCGPHPCTACPHVTGRPCVARAARAADAARACSVLLLRSIMGAGD